MIAGFLMVVKEPEISLNEYVDVSIDILKITMMHTRSNMLIFSHKVEADRINKRQLNDYLFLTVIFAKLRRRHSLFLLKDPVKIG